MTPFGALRTHGAGTLRSVHDGDVVTLGGWVDRRRDHGGVAFLDLRDGSGIVQVVADEDATEALAALHDVRSEWVLRITGTVRTRPAGMVNPALPTGEVEVAASAVEVLGVAATPPFPVEDGIDTDEVVRLTHRYVDLRRPTIARTIRTRSRITGVIRRVMESHGFLDIETPILTRATPEGARDFLVPSRLQKGSFYALPQSPQLFKQLLMVAGMERYYQIARCFRDEDLRADRQPEFTQLDVEASFVDEEDVYALTEELLATLWREVLGTEVATPFPRMTYAEAMRRYGSDKPDLRLGMELVDLAEVLHGTGVAVFSSALQAGGSVLGVTLPGGADLSRKQLDTWQEWARGRGAKGLAYLLVDADGTHRSPLAKAMAEGEAAAIAAAAGAGPGDAVFFAAGPTRPAQELLGALRVALAKERGLLADRWDFLWVVEAPVVEWNDDEGRWDAVHHPFTAPAAEWEDRLEQDPAAATARAYDVVLNGVELGGGSIRIHRRDLQERVFTLLGIDAVQAQEKFGFLLQGLSYGAPPHGGIALGLDRLVMLMVGAASLRDVIAFPKTSSGGDPMTAAPAAVDPHQLREVGIAVVRGG